MAVKKKAVKRQIKKRVIRKSVGRPTKYNTECSKQAAKLCELGATNRDLADFFEVSERTIERWSSENPVFCRALTVGKEPADEKVKRALFSRAIGYSHPDVDIRVIDGQVVKTIITKHYPPDTKAALAWLYNRAPNEFHPQPKDPEGSDGLDKIIEIIRATRPD